MRQFLQQNEHNSSIQTEAQNVVLRTAEVICMKDEVTRLANQEASVHALLAQSRENMFCGKCLA